MITRTCIVAAAMLGIALTAEAGLILTGVIDGPGSGQPKAIELFATSDIADLSVWGLESARNGAAFSGIDFTLSGSAFAGDFLRVASNSAGFQAYFGFANDFASAVANNNGNDAIGLYANGLLVDVFGDPADVSGSSDYSAAWAYQDSYAYRADGTGPDSPFAIANWVLGGNNLLDAQGATGVNGDAGITVPFGTYAPQAIPEPGTRALTAVALMGLGLLGLGARVLRRRRAA